MVASWPRSQGFKSQLLTVFFNTKFHHKKAISILRLERTQMGSKWLKRASIDANGLKLARIILSSGIRKWFFFGAASRRKRPEPRILQNMDRIGILGHRARALTSGVLEKSKIQKRRIFFLAFFHRVREDPQAYRLGEKIITSMHKIVRFIEAFYTRNFVIFSTCRSRYIKLSQLQTLGSFIAVRLETTLWKKMIQVNLKRIKWKRVACLKIRTQILRA